jgi:hypothetical protein
MLRSKSTGFRLALLPALLLALAPLAALAQDPAAAAALQSYFNGKEVTVLMDMPGSQKGVDLNFSKPSPMDWKEYSGRVKSYGVAIRKGDVARVTGIVVKKDRVEFQLNGGGFGTFGDDTNTVVTAKPVEKSDYEKNLENQIANTDDPDRKDDLQRQLDRERARRAREDAANRRAAQVASQIKAQQVAESRMQGGSRFNLRWQGKIPPDQLTPDAITKLLANYVSLDVAPQPDAYAPAPGYGPPPGYAPAPGYAPPQPAAPPAGAPAGQLQNGMHIDQVAALLGQGKQLSSSTSADGLKTEVYEYSSADRKTDVTYVNGVVVRFSISSK